MSEHHQRAGGPAEGAVGVHRQKWFMDIWFTVCAIYVLSRDWATGAGSQ